ncbi:MAG: EAL domain-containing protein [Thauera sp.]|jgi:hypothetical protein
MSTPTPRVLIDDDDPLQLRLLSRPLANAGIDAVAGHTGAATALERLRTIGAVAQPVRWAIFTGCLDMTCELRIHTVAEGVEDHADRDFMRASGCTEAQGYFISRPLAATALPAWHDGWLARCRELCP